MNALASCVLACLSLSAVWARAVPVCNSPDSYQVIPKDDCTGYYICVWGMPREMPDCPEGSSFSRTAHVCVPKGSIYDDCDVGRFVPGPDVTEAPKEPATIEEKCKSGASIIPHPTECQLYYDCQHKPNSVARHFEPYMRECPYPQLFNVEAKKCDHFENVKCGTRQEHVNGCDYRTNMCGTSHCIPCSVRMPSCEGKPDGINVHEGRPWSPYFVECYKDRLITQNACPAGTDGRAQLFHPLKRECVSLDEIPKEHGGTMPDCAGKSDGLYLDDFGRCDQYTKCQDGKVMDIVKCPHGLRFDALLTECKKAEDACGPCGKKDTC